MRATALLAGLLVGTLALGLAPTGQAVQQPPHCMGTSCCGIEPASAPCGPADPRCRETGVATTDILAYLGPHAGVRLEGDCSVTVWERGLRCETSVTHTGEVSHDAGPVQAEADVCDPATYCTCDPVTTMAVGWTAPWGAGLAAGLGP